MCIARRCMATAQSSRKINSNSSCSSQLLSQSWNINIVIISYFVMSVAYTTIDLKSGAAPPPPLYAVNRSVRSYIAPLRWVRIHLSPLPDALVSIKSGLTQRTLKNLYISTRIIPLPNPSTQQPNPIKRVKPLPAIIITCGKTPSIDWFLGKLYVE